MLKILEWFREDRPLVKFNMRWFMYIIICGFIVYENFLHYAHFQSYRNVQKDSIYSRGADGWPVYRWLCAIFLNTLSYSVHVCPKNDFGTIWGVPLGQWTPLILPLTGMPSCVSPLETPVFTGVFLGPPLDSQRGSRWVRGHPWCCRWQKGPAVWVG